MVLDFRPKGRSTYSVESTHPVRFANATRLAAALLCVTALLFGLRDWALQRDVTPAPGEPTPLRLGRRLQGLDPSRFDAVRDDTLLGRAAEHDAWFGTLALLLQTPQLHIDEASIGEVSYIQLDQQSPAYRGDVVTLRGVARRAHRLAAPANPESIDGYYQIFMQPADRPDAPVLVYVLELPDNFPLGMHIDEPVTVTGVYYKRTAYQGANDVLTAPTLLCRSLRWSPVAKPPAGGKSRQTLLVMATVLVGILVAGTAVRVLRRPSVGIRRGAARHPLPDQIELPFK